MHALLALLLLAAPAEARTAKKTIPRDPRTVGLGKSCHKNADCRHRSQRCMHQSDAQGKALDKGFCVLPCSSFESGTQRVTPGGAPVDVSKKAKKPPARCPPKFDCRSAGAGVPIDMCVKQ